MKSDSEYKNLDKVILSDLSNRSVNDTTIHVSSSNTFQHSVYHNKLGDSIVNHGNPHMMMCMVLFSKKTQVN